jgi:hypothetical protein
LSNIRARPFPSVLLLCATAYFDVIFLSRLEF